MWDPSADLSCLRSRFESATRFVGLVKLSVVLFLPYVWSCWHTRVILMISSGLSFLCVAPMLGKRRRGVKLGDLEESTPAREPSRSFGGSDVQVWGPHLCIDWLSWGG